MMLQASAYCATEAERLALARPPPMRMPPDVRTLTGPG